MITQGLDWFSFTLKQEYKPFFAMFEKFLEGHGDKIAVEKRSRWYKDVFEWESGVIMSQFPTSWKGNPFMVEIPGKPFRMFGKDLESLIVACISGMNVNRVDWRFDFISVPGELERVWYPSDFYGLKGQAIRPQFEVRGEEHKYTGIKSGKEEFVIRYYDKIEEGKTDLPVETCLDWWRFEWVVRKVLCKSQPWFRVTSIEELRGIMISLLYKRFHVPFHFHGVLESLPRIRYTGSLPERYSSQKYKVEREQAKLAEMEELLGCGALQEF